MKKYAKVALYFGGLIVSSSQTAATAPLGLARVALSAGKFALQSARIVTKHAAPAIKELVEAATPYVSKAVVFTEAHPDTAKKIAVTVGAGLGYATSDEGIINTTIGTALGALAGLSVITYTANFALQRELAKASSRIFALQEEVRLAQRAEVATRAALEKMAKDGLAQANKRPVTILDRIGLALLRYSFPI